MKCFVNGDQIDTFRLLNDCVTRLVSERPKLELSEILLMQVGQRSPPASSLLLA